MPKGVYIRTKTVWNKGLRYSGNPCSEETKQKIREAVGCGSKNHKWKGESVGYLGIHAWIRKIKGKPPRKCVDCKRTDRKRYDWSNIDHKYSRNPEDYASRCRGCHMKFDIKNNNWLGWGGRRKTKNL